LRSFFRSAREIVAMFQQFTLYSETEKRASKPRGTTIDNRAHQ
jgi:hypothetical protein